LIGIAVGVTGAAVIAWDLFRMAAIAFYRGRGAVFGYVTVGAPLWLLLSAVLVGVCAWHSDEIQRERRRRHYAPTRATCDACGYVVRESVQRCPECGAAILCATVAQQREVLAAAARLDSVLHSDRPGR
jgi:hypothetical protein